MKAIGIGCFWFARPGGEPTDENDFSPRKHIDEIRNALESIDNILNLKVANDSEQFIVSGDSYSDDEDEDEDDPNYFPLIGNTTINFDIMIPERLQEKYSIFGRGDAGVENFHVSILFGSGLPVTYISYDVKGGEAACHKYEPSTSVVFIREYLKEKLRGDKKIEFQCLGPSPFHADFFVTRREEGEGVVSKDISLTGRGYRTLYYEFADSEPKQINHFIAFNHEVFSTYYIVSCDLGIGRSTLEAKSRLARVC